MTNKERFSLLTEKHLPTGRAFFIGRHIPGRKITFGITLTAIEHRLIAAGFHDQLGGTFGAGHTYIASLGLGELTGRIS